MSQNTAPQNSAITTPMIISIETPKQQSANQATYYKFSF